MNQYKSVFDIIGPVMVGPSSSHTAGVARIGKVVRKIFGMMPDKVEIYLYDSFAKTYRGHGTDIALVGGLLGMEPDDKQLANSFMLAKDSGMEIAFFAMKEHAEHPNTVRMMLQKEEKVLHVTGASIGGGNIEISQIDGFKLSLNMATPTYLVIHQDKPGAISHVTSLLSNRGINIATMTMTREKKGERAIMLLEVDSKQSSEEIVRGIQALSEVRSVSFFSQDM